MVLFQSRKNDKKFIAQLGNYFNVSDSRVFLFGAGRMAVYSVLKSLKLKPEDEVIVAGYTCVVLTNAVKFANCKIKYVDISQKTLNIDKSLFISSINENTKVAIVPHNFGLVADFITEVKLKYPALIIIEDAAHTFGSKTNEGEFCGTLGDAAFFSLEYSKPVTTGLGGVLIINNTELLKGISDEYTKLNKTPFISVFKMILTLGVMTLFFSKKTSFYYINGLRLLRLFKLIYKTSIGEVNGVLPKNYPVRLNPLLSNFGYNQLRRINLINVEKQNLQNTLNEAFYSFQDIFEYTIKDAVLARFPILFKENVTQATIDNIKAQASTEGLVFGEWFNDVVHPKGSFRYGYTAGMCPEGEFVASRMLNIPINANNPIIDSEIEQLVAIFKSNGIR